MYHWLMMDSVSVLCGREYVYIGDWGVLPLRLQRLEEGFFAISRRMQVPFSFVYIYLHIN